MSSERACRFAAIKFEIAVKVEKTGLERDVQLCVVGIEVVVDRCRGDRSDERSGGIEGHVKIN